LLCIGSDATKSHSLACHEALTGIRMTMIYQTVPFLMIFSDLQRPF